MAVDTSVGIGVQVAVGMGVGVNVGVGVADSRVAEKFSSWLSGKVTLTNAGFM